MASVDVPVALLGYGTVGAAVDRLLAEQADEIERATGHRLRVVRALVRDPEKERAFAPAAGRAHVRPRRRARRPVDRPRRRGDGRARSRRAVRARAPRVGSLGRDGEQAARRATGRRALRGCGDLGRPAPLRGLGVRGDPGDQGAARVARRHERPPRARDRQRHDELHPLRDGRRPDVRARRSPRRSGSATRRPTRPTTWAGSTPRRRSRSSPPSRSARACRSTGSRSRASRT